MKALVYTAPEKIILQEVNDPVVGKGEVLVKVKCVGICGSDMHAYQGHDERRPAPLILGHEVAGIVSRDHQVTQRITVNPLVTCQHCEFCRSGRTNLCSHRQIISMPPRAGGFAQYVSIPEQNIYSIDDHINFEQAALAEPIAVTWHAVRLAREKSDTAINDSRILIIGGGAIGLSSALVCQLFGSPDICIAETNNLRHPILTRAGPFEVFNPIEVIPEKAFDIVIDAYGGTTTQEFASTHVKPGGVIVNLGLAGGKVGLNIRKMTLQDITFVGSYTYTETDFSETVSAINNNKLGKLDWYQSSPLEQGPQMFAQILSNQMPYPKVILVPDE